jgi:taurine dioxygenase
MHEHALQPVGVEVSGLDLDAAGPDDVDHLRDLLARHGVVIMRGQDVDDPAFLGFLRRFGELAFTNGEPPLPGFPDLNGVSNVGRTTAPRSTFHVDTSYVRHPPAYTALRAVRIPARGGETLFTNQYRAYDTLPGDVRVRLRGRTIRHQVTGLDLGPDDETAAEHPVFRPHPVSGRTALYLSTPQRCTSISGLDDAAAREMIDFLFAHSTAADNTHRHAWSTGDVVMWDNGCVLHRADHDGVVGDRVLHRGMVARYPVRAGTGARG